MKPIAANTTVVIGLDGTAYPRATERAGGSTGARGGGEEELGEGRRDKAATSAKVLSDSMMSTSKNTMAVAGKPGTAAVHTSRQGHIFTAD